MVWVQEEPRNQGAYLFIADRLRADLGIELAYIGRESSASPAVGSKSAHYAQQKQILKAAVGDLPAGHAKEPSRATAKA